MARTNKIEEKASVEIIAIETSFQIDGKRFKEARFRQHIFEDSKGSFVADRGTAFIRALVRRGRRRFEFDFLLNAKTKHGRCDVFHSCFDGELPDELKAYSARYACALRVPVYAFSNRFFKRM